ncbi:hypothetical protein THAOC_36438 [Thalassiosira oceanica]|uniref:Uncharacterized protein n=1 Tax=Thalassiosira oceanica TaxID=159749 RepID=K0R067_THAOC|nr:hypothetical protein THAOC_36438 [Thalassiosira oceanica]|eukprot:EJK44980.1 hypothetical protein THAOC_36438 [Thalassiosira oceanica]
MNAFGDSLEAIWESKGLEKVQVVRVSDKDFENGIDIIVRGHNLTEFSSSKLNILSPSDAKLSTTMTTLFALLWIGDVNVKETASKTECVFFTRPSFFGKKKSALALTNKPFIGSIVQSAPVIENAPVEKCTPSWRERREVSTERAKKKAELVKTQ